FTPKALVLSRKSTDIFDELRHRDILLHHPYDSYDPVVEFVQLGAQDPAVLVRRDEDGVTRRYCHLGTGNYNPITARFYTDLSLLTCDPKITERVHMVFNYLTAHAELDDYTPLLVAPLTMAESFLRLIRREQEHAQAGRPAHIVAKMNALLEPSVIEALYQAAQSGVEIDLIVRGPSLIRPGVKGLSERIRVRSIVGRFLEHSRIFHFANGGNDEIYIGSPDWMPRNFF